MLLHGGFYAIERAFQRPCSLFLRFRLLPAVNVVRRNAGSKEMKRVGKRDTTVLEKVLFKEPKSAAEKVKQKATNAYLYMAYIVSVVVFGGMAYMIYEEILAPGAPQTVFSKALSLIKKDSQCQRLFGEPIMGYVEGPGRMKQVIHHTYKKDGHDRIRIIFNVKGSRREGIATAEMEKIDGSWEWRFLIASTDELVPENIVLVFRGLVVMACAFHPDNPGIVFVTLCGKGQALEATEKHSAPPLCSAYFVPDKMHHDVQND